MKKLKVKNSRDLGILFAENDLKMIGQDGAYSIPIKPNESLWLFGDTFIGHFNEIGGRVIEQMPNNSGLICRDRDASNGLKDFHYLTDKSGQIRQLIPLEPDEDHEKYRIWGMHGCFWRGKVYWYYIRVKILKEGVWPYKFDVAGSGLAVANYPHLEFQRIKENGSTILWQKDEPSYGVAVLIDEKENYVYLYGSYLQNGKHLCALARVRPDSLAYPSYYEYLVSQEPRWSPDRSKAISIMEGMPTEMSVSFNEYLGCYLAVHSLDITGLVVGRTSPTPWGPWSAPVTLRTPKVPLRNPLVYGGPLVYAGKEHPEYKRKNGKIIYLTCVEFEEYFPRLIEVELE
ncbi:MAG: DUF4185 domain-containing protein [Calditrichaeota bacterium]|nr:DUF4185 domain-containing protein [Calditrichota bacterium]